MNIAKRVLWTLGGFLIGVPLVILANDYYNATGIPAPGSPVSSAEFRTEFAAIETGMGKLPALTGNGGKLVRINAGGAALESFADAGTLTVPFTAACTVDPTLGFDYSKVGHTVTLAVNANGGTCTGNSTSFASAAAALPAEIRPAGVVTSPSIGGFVNAGSGTEAALRLSPDGTISFIVPVGGAYTVWTASGNRQASYASITYVVP